MQEIPMQLSLVLPVRTVQEAVAAGDLPPLDLDAAHVFSQREHIMQEHICKNYLNTMELKDLRLAGTVGPSPSRQLESWKRLSQQVAGQGQQQQALKGEHLDVEVLLPGQPQHGVHCRG
jgi:hypothetical protein